MVEQIISQYGGSISSYLIHIDNNISNLWYFVKL